MRRRLAAVALALAVAGSVGAAEPSASQPPQDIASELRAIHVTLHQLVELLQGQAETQRMSLWMQRIELTQRRLAPLEQERRGIEADLEAVMEERDQLRARLAAVEEGAEAAERRLEGSSPDLANLRAQLEVRRRFLDERLRSLEARLVTLDNDIAERRHDLEGWERLLDRHLSAAP